MKCMTVVGTRPEFIQITPLTKTLRRRFAEVLVNTGQHYDDNMSKIFFRELELPQPDISLGVGSGSHAEQTGEIMIRLEPVLLKEKPDYLIVYGDTNSTVAAALTAAKIHIPVVHIEAGLRSFDKSMPEEINRIVTDHVSDLLFAPTDVAVKNLQREGISQGVFQTGDVRVDVLLGMVERARARLPHLKRDLRLRKGESFALTTIHRASNTDDPERLRDIVHTLSTVDLPIVLPVHPRLRKMLGEYSLSFSENVRATEPLGFLDMVALLDGCEIVITDSGGLQKEAYMLHRPLVTVRDTTEWVETVHSGWNRLCEPEPSAFKAAVAAARGSHPAEHPDFYGAPGVAERMTDILAQHLS